VHTWPDDIIAVILRKETVSSEAPHANPITEFRTAIERAEARGVDTTLVALATADANGRPSVRMVLLRGVDERGFVFHTNYKSRKARELDANPFASLCFHWPTLEEQIRVEGSVARLPDDESDAYFAGRPRGSQLGAWTSAQSEILESRERFDQEYTATEARFAGQEVPRPPFWGGFLIDPSHIEFWYGRTDRLHDRILYVREGTNWTVRRLYP
jgi:pyridoxamine 5'-phosphate oxidase